MKTFECGIGFEVVRESLLVSGEGRANEVVGT